MTASTEVIRKATARVRVDGREIDLHYRVAGQGPALFALHPSPLDSTFLVPLMARFASRATVIAPDTPGFGFSDPLPGPIKDLAPCVRAMAALRKALGLRQAGVYGSATGAQIAVEWAKAEPEALSGVMLDNAAAFDDAERARIMDGYLPDVTQSADGAHLARAWQASHDATLFFPWQSPCAGNRIAPAPGAAEAMHATAAGYLRAGPAYASVYRAAFRNERVERLLPVAIPLVIVRWQGSILARWTRRLDTQEWGPNVTMAHCGPSLEERWTCLERHLGRILPTRCVKADELCLDSGRFRHVDSHIGQIRYLVNPEGTPRRLLVPPPGASVASLDPAWRDDRTVMVDLPGHGGSARPESIGLSQCVEAICRVTDTLDVASLQVAGVGASDVIASAASTDPRLVHATVDLAGYRGVPADLTPEHSGAHLFRAWHWLREQFLVRDQPPPDPVRLTRMLLDLIDARIAHRLLHDVLDDEATDHPHGKFRS